MRMGSAGRSRYRHGADLIVVVDVLSYSTAVDIAASRGAMIYPHPWKDALGRRKSSQEGLVRPLASGQEELAVSRFQPVSIAGGHETGQEVLLMPSPNGSGHFTGGRERCTECCPVLSFGQDARRGCPSMPAGSRTVRPDRRG